MARWMCLRREAFFLLTRTVQCPGEGQGGNENHHIIYDKVLFVLNCFRCTFIDIERRLRDKRALQTVRSRRPSTTRTISFPFVQIKSFLVVPSLPRSLPHTTPAAVAMYSSCGSELDLRVGKLGWVNLLFPIDPAVPVPRTKDGGRRRFTHTD